MTSQILKSVDFKKTRKSKYLKSKENNSFYAFKGYFIAKNSFIAEVVFNTSNREVNFKNTP